jgi:hypothetical protein
MKKFILLFLFIIVSSLMYAQTEITTPSGKNVVFSVTTVDSVTAYYSNPIDLQGYLPQDINTNQIPFYIIGSGTKDSIKATIQARMLLNNKGTPSYSTWKTIDTVMITFNKVDGYAYNYNLNLNLNKPDQIRFVVQGASSVNRANTVIKLIAVLTKQYAVFKVQ